MEVVGIQGKIIAAIRAIDLIFMDNRIMLLKLQRSRCTDHAQEQRLATHMERCIASLDIYLNR